MPVTMKQWAVVNGNDNPYQPPEVRGIRLNGIVYGHPRKPDGDHVTTSPVQAARGRVIETMNTTYVLDGPPDEAYAAFCREHSIALDPENPITTR